LSPWIHRALTAGGFGLGISSSKVPRDFAAVVPYRDGRSSLPDSNDLESEDIEEGIKKSHHQVESGDIEYEPLLPINTPFFHIDLQSAVRAAESGVPVHNGDAKSSGLAQ
jgi:solute carrier family 26 (sodium-independent sulfate anion transporter), member 11